MLRTAVLLVLTLVVLPIVALRQDVPLDALQWGMLRGGIALALGFALYAFVASELTRNYSQVDRLWSIVPAVFSWYFAARSGWQPRLVLMASLATVWAVRLTFNFWRRGGFAWPPWRGIEDYRWEVVRAMPGFRNPHVWRLFNFGFVSVYQLLLLLLITVPSVVAARPVRPSLSWMDGLVAVLFLVLLAIETLADQQQYEFQTEKYRRKAAGEPLTGDFALGFRTTGLYGLVRRPNFAAEQAIWVVYYGFSVAATGRWLNWSAIGALLLMLLFQGSVDLTEKITASKYPAYADYRRRVPLFLPRPWGRRAPSTEAVGS